MGDDANVSKQTKDDEETPRVDEAGGIPGVDTPGVDEAGEIQGVDDANGTPGVDNENPEDELESDKVGSRQRAQSARLVK